MGNAPSSGGRDRAAPVSRDRTGGDTSAGGCLIWCVALAAAAAVAARAVIRLSEGNRKEMNHANHPARHPRWRAVPLLR